MSGGNGYPGVSQRLLCGDEAASIMLGKLAVLAIHLIG
jgi:hypothetical protein